AAESVEHLDERHAPALAQLETRHAREPVVRVDDVVLYPLRPAMRFDALDELRQAAVERLTRARRRGARRQMDAPRALSQLGRAGDRGVLRAREDVHGN